MTTWLIELGAEECRGLLRGTILGRVSVMVDGHPEIFPVNHVYDDDFGVTFPTNDGTKLRAALDWPWMCFEVDGIEDDLSSAWSVMVVGRAETIDDAHTCARLASRRTVRWRAGGNERWVRIEATKVTGRRVTYSL